MAVVPARECGGGTGEPDSEERGVRGQEGNEAKEMKEVKEWESTEETGGERGSPQRAQRTQSSRRRGEGTRRWIVRAHASRSAKDGTPSSTEDAEKRGKAD